MSKTIIVETPAPRNAIEAVQFSMQRFDGLDVTSTAGLQNNTKALWAAINALAMYVDGESRPLQHAIKVPDHYVAPDVKPAHSEADRVIDESRPAVVRDPSGQVVAA